MKRRPFCLEEEIGSTCKNFSELVMKILDSAFAFTERTLAVRGQRMEVLSKNIANADTPNYKAQDVDFRSVLKGTQLPTAMNATQKGHFSESKMISDANLFYTTPLNSSVDGNTVELSVEQAKYGRAAAQYQATLRFIESDVSGIRKALKGE
jgi:flagellar basal-body rod protein FlgB